MASAPHPRRALGLLTTALLATGLILPATASATEARAEETADPEAGLVVAPGETVLEDDAQQYEFEVLVENTGEAVLPAGSVTLRLAGEPLASRAELTEPIAVAGVSFAEASTGAIDSENRQTVSITVERDAFPLSSTDEPGAYLLEARLELDAAGEPTAAAAEADEDPADAAVASATVPVIWRGVDGKQLPLSSIVPFVLPEEISTIPSRDEVDALIPKWESLLDAATAARATLAIDPRVIAGIRAAGDDASERSRDFLQRLETSVLPSFLLQFADADPSAQAAIGLSELLSPETLDFASRSGTFSGTSAVDPQGSDGSGSESTGDDADDETGTSGSSASGTAAGSAESGAGDAGAATEEADETDETGEDGAGDQSDPTLPTLQQLMAWQESEATAWPAEGSVDEDTVALLRDSGITALVLDSENASVEGGPRAQLSPGTALVTDHELAEAARSALDADEEIERDAAFAELAAHLALAAGSGSSGLILGLDRGAVAESEDPAQLLESVAALPWIDATPTVTQTEGRATLLPPGAAAEGDAASEGDDASEEDDAAAAAREERSAALTAALEREDEIIDLAPVLAHPEYLSGYQRARVLGLFATRYAGPSSGFSRIAAAFAERDAELLEGVGAVTTEHIQLVSASTRIPLQLHNALPFDAVVVVEVDPTSAALVATERRFADVVVPAEANERVLVPVRSRVSSAESGLAVTVTAADGEPVVYAGSLSISVQSGVERIALWAIAILSALLLGFGIWRSVRRRLRGGTPPSRARTARGGLE